MPIKPCVDRLVHHTHTTGTDLTHDAILRKGTSSGQHGHGCNLIGRIGQFPEYVTGCSVSGDQTRLDYHFTITDDETFTEPATIEGHRLALEDTIPVYDCQTG